MNSFNEIFPLARMFALAVMHRGSLLDPSGLDKVKVKIISYLRKCYLTQKYRGPIKYFELAPPKFYRSGDGKRIIFKSSLIKMFI